MKKMNKVIAAMMFMAITAAMPAMAGNKKHHNDDKRATVVVVTNKKKVSHFDALDKRTVCVDAHKRAVARPYVKSCTFSVDRHVGRNHVVARAERIPGVVNAYWDPRTRLLTVCYDARMTSARHIMHTMA